MNFLVIQFSENSMQYFKIVKRKGKTHFLHKSSYHFSFDAITNTVYKASLNKQD